MKSKSSAILIILIFIAVLAAFKAGAISFGGQKNSQTAQAQNVDSAIPTHTILVVGQKAPDFTLTDVDGKVFSLNALLGKPVILFGMASWCGECIGEGQDLTKIQQSYGDKVQIIGVAFTQGDTKDTILQFKQIGKVNIPLALDTDHVTQKYQLINLDSTYFINRLGIISYISSQGMNYQDIKEQLDKIL